MLRYDLFPITMRFLSGRDGSVVWSRTIARPDGLALVEIPSFRNSAHWPVTCEIEFADGQKVTA